MSERTVEAKWMSLAAVACLLVPGAARAEGYDPYAVVPKGSIEVDMAEVLRSPAAHVPAPQEQPDLSKLGTGPVAAPKPPGKLPAGWVQLGEVVQREEVALGFQAISPEPSQAWEDLEGNQYPRKHTLFLNFNGGVLYGGEDNSAENKSTLARAGENYPAYAKAESTALATIQRVKEDMASFGVRVVYEKRPSKTVPYTMAMVGGDWTDANLDSPAGGVAPGTDCEARGQRHVVYVFDESASTIGQEAAHAWGLDHTLGGDRIMSYQFGNNKHFGDNCQDLCEEACQGPGTIGCRMIHDIYCPGGQHQNDLAELNKIFGGNEPDTEPPRVKVAAPENGAQLAAGSDFKILGDIADNYGGVGWKLIVKVDGKIVLNQVDYDRVMSWTLTNVPKGVYEITIEAEDHADHVVSDTITIFVGTTPTPGGDSGGDSDSNSGGDTPTTSDTSNDSEAGGDASGGESQGGSDEGDSLDGDATEDDRGCRISSQGGGSGGPLGLLAPVLGLGLAWRARRVRA